MVERKAISKKVRAEIVWRSKGLCADCGADIGKLARLLARPAALVHRIEVNRILREAGFKPGQPVFHIDHIVPVVEGGSNDPSNLRVLCVHCHSEWTSGLAKRRRRKGRMR